MKIQESQVFQCLHSPKFVCWKFHPLFFHLGTSKRILDCLLGRSLNRCLNLGRPASGRCSPCGSRGGPRWDPPAAEGCLGVSLELPQRRRGGPPRWQPAQSLWGFSTGGPGRAWGLAHTWGGLLVRDPSATWDDAPGAYNGVAKAGANGHTGAVPTDCEYRHCGFIDTERHILLSGRTWGSSTLTTCATSVDTSSCCHLNGCSKAACLAAWSTDVSIPPLAFARHYRWMAGSGRACSKGEARSMLE